MSGWWQISTSIVLLGETAFLINPFAPHVYFKGIIFLLCYFVFARFSLRDSRPFDHMNSFFFHHSHATWNPFTAYRISSLHWHTWNVGSQYIINQSDPFHGKILHFHVHFTITPAKLTLSNSVTISWQTRAGSGEVFHLLAEYVDQYLYILYRELTALR